MLQSSNICLTNLNVSPQEMKVGRPTAATTRQTPSMLFLVGCVCPSGRGYKAVTSCQGLSLGRYNTRPNAMPSVGAARILPYIVKNTFNSGHYQMPQVSDLLFLVRHAMYTRQYPCHRFLYFPVLKTSNCAFYFYILLTIATGQGAGDPHISTLDGLTYSFNGLAEYVLLEGNNFTLQGRTDFAYTTNPPSRATVFTALAAQQRNPGGTDSDIVELKMNGTGLGRITLRLLN